MREPELTNNAKSAAMMFMSESCPHCPAMMANLIDLLKSGELASLEIMNIEYHAQRAQELNVRSLPWLKIAYVELEGLHSASELKKWVGSVNTIEGMCDYLVMLLESGKLQKAELVVAKEADGLGAVLALLENAETNISVRTGLSVLLEGFEGSDRLKKATSRLTSMLGANGANIRADACFFLGLTHNPMAIKSLEPMLNDRDEHVQEIASESIEKLRLI